MLPSSKAQLQSSAWPSPPVPTVWMTSQSQSSKTGNRPQPQTLTCNRDSQNGSYHIHWVVDARKLFGNDKQVVSPAFELCLGSIFSKITFKVMLYPKSSNDARGGAAFKKSHGRGFLQLKCEGDVSETMAHVGFFFRIGSCNEKEAEPKRGPVLHNFAKRCVCGLRKSEELWDFGSAVNEDSMTFNVFLEVEPQAVEVPALCFTCRSAFSEGDAFCGHCGGPRSAQDTT